MKTLRQPYPLTLAVFGLLLLVASWLSLSLGPLGLLGPEAWGDILASLVGAGPEADPAVVSFWHLRFPRWLLGVGIGAQLAVAGVIMQALFANPLAEPYLTGVSAGAALGAIAALLFGLGATLAGPYALGLCGFMGATGTAWLVFTLARRGRRVPVAALLLTGLAVSALWQALATFLLLQADPFTIRHALTWLMGSLAYRDRATAFSILGPLALGLIFAWRYRRLLNALTLGEESAFHLGVDVARARRYLLLLATLLAASAVAACGIVAFVGLIVPHLLRLMVGGDHRRLLPATALGGALLVLVADLLARTLAPGRELPLSVVTGFAGALVFLYLLRRQRLPLY